MKSSSLKKSLAVIVAFVMSFTTICAPLTVLSADTAADSAVEAGWLEIKPLRYDYKIGEQVELDVFYVDGNAGITTQLSEEQYVIEEYDMYSPGYKNINVRYGNIVATVEVYYEGDIAVDPDVEPLSYVLHRTEYNDGESLDISVYYYGNEIYPESYTDDGMVIEGYIVMGYDPYSQGEQCVYISYNGYTTGEFYVTVIDISEQGTLAVVPHATEFYVGEPVRFDLVWNYPGGNSEWISPEEYTYDEIDVSTPGWKTITVYYGDYVISEDVYYVEVPDSVLDVNMLRDVYYIGEQLEVEVYFNGMQLMPAEFTDDGMIIVDGYTIDGYDPYLEGMQHIVVGYNGYYYSATVEVLKDDTVVDVYITGINAYSNREAYSKGDDLDLTVQVEYSDGSTAIVSDYTVDGYDPYVTGWQAVSVYYREFATKLEVYVQDNTDDTTKEIVNVFATDYVNAYVGETPYIKMYASYSDGTERRISSYGNDCYTLSGYDPSIIGEQIVDITYGGYVITITVNVTERSADDYLAYMDSHMNKTEYALGEQLDVVVVAYYYNGNGIELSPDQYVIEGYDCWTIGYQDVTIYYENMSSSWTVNVIGDTTDNQLTGIEVINNRGNYSMGEDLDLTVIGNYSNGEAYEISNYTVSGYDPYTPGWQYVTVTYLDYITGIDVYVEEYIQETSIYVEEEVYTYPGQKPYFRVVAYDSEGAPRHISCYGENPYYYSGYNTGVVGRHEVTVTYNGMETTAYVNVMEKPETMSIEYIDVVLNENVYNMGEGLDLVVYGYYTGGVMREISSSQYIVSGYDNQIIGDQEIVVSFANHSLSYIVTVIGDVIVDPPVDNDEIYALEVSHKLTYNYGEPHDFIVKAEYADGRIEEIFEATADGGDGYTIVGYDPYTIGKQMVYVSYRDFVVDFEIEVLNPEENVFLTDLRVENNKEQYNIGDSLELSVFALYSNGDVVEVYDYNVEGYDPYVSGWQTVTVTYQDFVYDIDVYVAEEIVEPPIEDKTLIEIYAVNNREQYYVGDDLDISVFAKYSDNTEAQITNYTVEGFDSYVSGYQDIVIRYGDFECYMTVYVAQSETLQVINLKNSYTVGDELELRVFVSGDGYERELTRDEYTIENYNRDKVGTQIVKVVYNGLEAEIQIYVDKDNSGSSGGGGGGGDTVAELKGITVDSDVECYVGETPYFNVYADYSDGTIRKIEPMTEAADGYTIEGFDPSVAGEQSVTVSYHGISVNTYVYVKAEEAYITAIRVQNNKDEYFVGDQLDISVFAVYSDETEEEIYNYRVTGFESTCDGTKEVVVYYDNFTYQMVVYVAPVPEKSIIYMEDATTLGGLEIKVPVYISNNRGFAAFDIEVYYDNTMLVPVSIEKGEIMTGNITSNLSSSFDAANSNFITAVAYGKENITADGVLFYITFNVLEGTVGSTSPDIVVVEMYDQDRKYIESEIRYGTIDILNALYGDADGNGAISVADLIFMSQYVANWSGDYDEVFMKLADVYNDGTVNTKDIVLLSRYIAKIPGIELGKPVN